MSRPFLLKTSTVSALGGQPIGSSRFSEMMRTIGPFEVAPRIAVGVSGGSDSLGLAFLLNQWASTKGGEAIALTVDHGLRPESGSEARQVKKWLNSIGMSHRTLRWMNSSKNNTGVQAAARFARLKLMGKWCRDNSIIHLLIAHHQEDQSDTFLTRLASGSGMDGLAAMSKSRLLTFHEGGGIRLLRPLLNTPSADLSATLETYSQPWVSDPSNSDAQFIRARLQASRKTLAREGLSTKRLTQASVRAGRDRATFELTVSRFLADNALYSPIGYISLKGFPWSNIPQSILIRAFTKLIATFSGATKPPPLRKIEFLIENLRTQKLPFNRTLGGCRFIWKNSNKPFLIVRESGRIKDIIKISPGEKVHWDGRFIVGLGNMTKISGYVRKLTQEDIAHIRRFSQNGYNFKQYETLPSPVKLGLPAIEGLDGCIKIPHLGYVVHTREPWAQFSPSISLCESIFNGASNL